MKILYIDDDPFQRLLLAEMLGLYGFEVEVAEDGYQGIKKAIVGRPDLILVDAYMPRMDGVEAITTIRHTAQIAETPIISLSARADYQHKKAVLQAGANEFFAKPVDVSQLVPAINTCLTKS